MSFLNPWLLLGVLGVSLPILAHLLNRYQVKQTDWAAMRFLDRSVRVRSRQLRLRDILLLILRCLALLLVVLALSRPSHRRSEGLLASVGQQRTAVILALDASYSMQYGPKANTRFDEAMRRIDAIRETLQPGDPVSLVLLGGKHNTVAENIAYRPDAFDALLRAQTPTAEVLNLDRLPAVLRDLADGMNAPQKEIYIVTDLQAQDWANRANWFYGAMKSLTEQASVFVVPVGSGSDNLAITGLELESGVLRKGTTARYRVTVRNDGESVAEGVQVSGRLNNITVDTKVIARIAPGTAESVSLFLTLRDTGPVQIAAELASDNLEIDNRRHAVTVVRDRVSVLCVEGASAGAGQAAGLIAVALRASGGRGGQHDLDVQQVSWVDLPGQDLSRFDVVILSDVPDITPEQADALDRFVRAGNGLIWFGGELVKADIWNRRSAVNGTTLLPANIEGIERTGDAMGLGRPVDPNIPDHPVCRPLMSLPADLLSEARFYRLLRVSPVVGGSQVLSLAGSDSPLLLERSLGRGHVFMFTTSAGSAWNNMAVTPLFPMLLHQMVTYLTAREFETPRLVGDALSLSYVDQPNVAEAVFESPSGNVVTVPVEAYRSQYVAVMPEATETGFYMARVQLQAEGVPIAVNVDTRESAVAGMPLAAAQSLMQSCHIDIVRSEDDIQVIADSRVARSLWRLLLLGGLLLLVLEALLAAFVYGRGARRRSGDEGGDA